MDFYAAIVFVIVISASVESLKVSRWDYIPTELPKECRGRPCVMKCCPEGEILYKIKNATCRRIEDMKKYDSRVLRELTEKDFIIETSNGTKSAMRLQDFHIFYGRKCLNGAAHVKGNLLESGGLTFSNITVTGATYFCMDWVITRSKTTNEYRTMAHYRYWGEPHKHYWQEVLMDKYRIIGRCISGFFLLLVLCVYAALRQLRAQVFGALVMAYVSSMTLRIVLQIAMQLNDRARKDNCLDVDKDLNAVLCPMFHFFVVTSFFWLTFMSFSIWRCFRMMTAVVGMSSSGNYRRSFLKYWAAAWGAGGLLTGSVIIVEHSQSQMLAKPNFAKCFANSGHYYLHGPILVCITCNVIFYTMTFVNMWKVRGEVKEHLNKKLSKKNRKGKSVFLTSLNIFLIMGASYIIDITIAFLSRIEYPVVVYILLTMLNEFTGVVFFIILVLKKRVIVLLRNKFNIKNKLVMNLVDSKATTRTRTLRTNCDKSYAKSTNNSIKIEECNNFSQSEAGYGKQDTLKFYGTIPEVVENERDLGLPY